MSQVGQADSAQTDAADIADVGVLEPAYKNGGNDVKRAHFIVLIDDSGDMASYRSRIISRLPAYLFPDDVMPEDADRLTYEPQTDRLTVLFFTIHCSGAPEEWEKSGCKRPSVDPYCMFCKPEMPAGADTSRDEFAEWLGQEMRLDCRFDGCLSPIASSQPLALCFLRDQLPENELYTRTFFLVVTNEQTNLWAPAASELNNMNRALYSHRETYLDDLQEAKRICFDVSRYFTIHAPLAWEERGGGLGLLLSELKPLAPGPRSMVRYYRTVGVDRRAISETDILLVPTAPDRSYIEIYLNGGLEPRLLQLQLRDPRRGAWKPVERFKETLGGITYHNRLDLKDSLPPNSFERDNRLTVPCLDPDVKRIVLTPDDPLPQPGKLLFKAGFGFETGGIYDHAYLETEELTINLHPVDLVKVEGSFVFPEVELTNEELVKWWKKLGGAGINTNQVRELILARRGRQTFLLFVGLFIAAVFMMFVFYQKYFHRPFKPRLIWEPANSLEVDFENPAKSRMLAGRFVISNPHPVPWFGRLVRNKEQPTRVATIRIDDLSVNGSRKGLSEFSIPEAPGDQDLAAIGAIGCEVDYNEDETRMVGFPSAGSSKLTWRSEETISDSREIPLFLATETIHDWRGEPGDKVEINFRTDLRWQGASWWAREKNTLLQQDTTFGFSFEIRPEKTRKPIVHFGPVADEKLYFKKDKRVKIGEYVFESAADHEFSEAFEDEFALKVKKNGIPEGGEPIVLEHARVHLEGKGSSFVTEIYFNCDGTNCKNPDPSHDDFEFTLFGPMDNSSLAGPHHSHLAKLYRDPMKAEIELIIEHLRNEHEIYWPAPEGDPCRRIKIFGADIHQTGLPLPDGRLDLPAFTIEVQESSLKARLVAVRIGNSGQSGRGVVSVDIEATLRGNPEYMGYIKMRDGRPVQDLVSIQDHDQLSSHAEVLEGKPSTERVIYLNPGLIEEIAGVEIPEGELVLDLDLDITVTDDQGTTRKRRFAFPVPFGLEQLPRPTWLAIDFGTSAIAAAFGTDSGRDIETIDLQTIITSRAGKSLATFDTMNSEAGTPFLPSCIALDAEDREGKPDGDYDRPTKGFPNYRPSSLVPGEPHFISLPATSQQLISDKEKVVLSLKSWAAMLTTQIQVGPVKYQDEKGELVESSRIDLAPVFQSALAALAEGYILADRDGGSGAYQAAQLILAHPNVFSSRHKEMLHEIACDALMRRFRIPIEKRIHLISESDAVAFDFLLRRMWGLHNEKPERILVYDFGAGTLDISIMRVKWKDMEDTVPLEVKIECRTGVPVAGNHLDTIVARIIHDLIARQSIKNHDKIDYKYEIVARKRKIEESHRTAAFDLWREIRKAKHVWDGKAPLKVTVGNSLADVGVVVYSTSGKASAGKGEAIESVWPAPTDDEPGFFEAINEERNIKDVRISIPADMIHNDPRIIEYLEFVTRTVPMEALNLLGYTTDMIDTLLISGRGSLWPGLRDRVRGTFPMAEVDFTEKSVVVKGAIARQAIHRSILEQITESQVEPTLGILHDNDTKITLEDDWGEGKHPISLHASPYFRIVQIMLRDPRPLDDRQPSSLRKHFYVNLTAEAIPRTLLWDKYQELFVRKETTPDGKLTVTLSNTIGQSMDAFGSQDAAPAFTPPPWPVGRPLLEPETQEDR
jgi:hypothetical protein